MDVSTLQVADTASIHVKGPDGQPLYDGESPVRIVIYGPGSRAFASVESKQTARALRRMNDNNGKLTAATAEERLTETAEDLAAITVSFENLSCGKLTGRELFEAVYGDQKLGFIAAQVTKQLGDWSVFKQGSVTS